MNEIWKQYNNTQYSVSNLGRLRNDKTATILAGNKNAEGYIKFGMWHGSIVKTVVVHRLIAEMFVDNPDNKPCVNHKDSDRSNNAASNLEWVTTSENITHAYTCGNGKVGEDSVHATLSEANVIEILKMVNLGVTTVEISKKFGCSTAAISHIRLNKTWKHIPREPAENLSQKGKLTPDNVREIRKLLAASVNKQSIATMFGVHRGTIAGIASGKIWKNY
jgi:hypothetical protein